MKYYSETLNKFYDSEKDLVNAEQQYAQEKADAEAKQKALQEARTDRAKEVEMAYKDVINAYNKYLELKNKFIDDYHSFHMSFSTKLPMKEIADFDIIDFLLNF